jgi:hypothetical protein
MPAVKLIILVAVLTVLGRAASAQVHGVDVQVNEGLAIPTTEQLQAILGPGDFVRDMLGWGKVDPACDLAGHPSAAIKIPVASAVLYDRVQAAGGLNFVTLGFNNTGCGQSSASGAQAFPNTDALRAEFAAYAARVAQQVPALGGISIWNEMNGSWKGGYQTPAEALAGYCLLANAVIAAVRKVNPTLPIAIGATVGWNIDGWFIAMFDTYGCVGKGDPSIWLDVHPYLIGKKNGRDTDWQMWNKAVANIRADTIGNPLFATEWGGTAAMHWTQLHPAGNYIKTFNATILSSDSSWAGAVWYTMFNSGDNGNYGLFNATGTMLTPYGVQYTRSFGP